MNKAELAELLKKYVNGECTEDEISKIHQWYHSFEDDHDHISSLSDADLEVLGRKIYDSIANNIEKPEDVALQRKIRYRILYSWYSAAAAIVVLISAIAFLFYQKQKTKDVFTADIPFGSEQVFSVTNNTDRLHKIILPDNSAVWMSPHAQLSYPKVFDKRSRNVSMSGECFFEVTKNPEQPFIINSRSIITKVWGTSFRVKDLSQSDFAEVSVVTGKVSVSIKSNDKRYSSSLKLEKGEVMIYPHQKAVFALNQHLLKEEPIVNEPSLQQWSRLNLVFNDKPLKDIIPVLDSQYHVHIVTTNKKLDQYILNADFEKFNLPDVLEALRKSLNVNYEIKNNTIELE
jgi:ferric-dicitrate binding protein FerR (iron transport regulator)